MTALYHERGSVAIENRYPSARRKLCLSKEGKLELLRLAAYMPHLTERMSERYNRASVPQEAVLEQRGEIRATTSYNICASSIPV